MTAQPTAQQFSDLRKNFLKKLEAEGGDALVHPADLNKVKANDDWLRRFLLHVDLDFNDAEKMLWDTCIWRKETGVNDINETNIKMDYLIEGMFFIHGKDKDGSTLLIFKCKKHTKGAKDFEELKRCIVYWFERLEKQVKGAPITIFFDMEGCGLSNMDMELTKYLIGLFKLYYPYFLNYILIFEMAWILNAAFKIIKSWLPEKAVAKIKFVNKGNLKEYVLPDQALKCWGGQDDFVYSFVPESTPSSNTVNNNSTVNKKVHFADGSPMTETSSYSIGDQETEGSLRVSSPGVVNFIKDGNELSSVLEITNVDDNLCLSFKIKTTSPEKFRVRPSAGCLSPGESVTIIVALQPGFQLGGLTRDKFLIMSMPIENKDISSQDLAEMWKSNSGKNLFQHRLRCTHAGMEITKNGSAVAAGGGGGIGGGSSSGLLLENEHNHLTQLSASVTELSNCHMKLHQALKRTQMLQWCTLAITVLLAIALMLSMRSAADDDDAAVDCRHPRTDL